MRNLKGVKHMSEIEETTRLTQICLREAMESEKHAAVLIKSAVEDIYYTYGHDEEKCSERVEVFLDRMKYMLNSISVPAHYIKQDEDEYPALYGTREELMLRHFRQDRSDMRGFVRYYLRNISKL